MRLLLTTATPTATRNQPVAPRVTVESVIYIHLIRTYVMTARWRQYAVATASRQLRARLSSFRPLARTANRNSRLLAVATVAPGCGLPAYSADPSTAQPVRVGGVE